MSSTEVVISPTKKTKQKMEQQQIVSSDVTNGCSDIIDGNNSISDESVNQQALINNNINDTNNKDCNVDVCMEPLLIQDCVDDQFDATNPINETNSVLSDPSESPNEPITVCDIMSKEKDIDAEDENASTIDSGGGFMKTNLSLNLNSETILMSNDDEKLANLPKNKKFLESSEDQIMNQIFFQTITVTPTTDEDILLSSCKYLNSDNTPLTPSDIDSDLIVGPVDFFNRKIDEDETFDTTYTDTADNYQENDDGNLCSLNDNFNENYCSFSSIDYNTTNIQIAQENNNQTSNNSDEDRTPENDLLQPDTFLGEYAEQMRKQRPSIVIDCYDSDSKTEEEEENVVIGDEKINDYCFYFDQTIEEDDDDPCFNISDVNESLCEAHIGNDDDNEESTTAIQTTDLEASSENNGKTLKTQGEEDDKDECFEETEEEEMSNDDDENSSAASDDEGVINESCLSVNSAVESFESESTVVKKSVKKSVKSTKTTKKSSKTISTTESITSSSKAESFENSISNGSIEMIEQQTQQKIVVEQQQKSITTNNSSAKVEHMEAIEQEKNIEENHQLEQVGTNGIEKKKGTSGKKKSKKKKSDEKENISVNTSTSMQHSMSIVSQPVKVIAPIAVTISNHTHSNLNCNNYNHDKLNDVNIDEIDCHKNINLTSSIKSNNHQKFIMSSSFQLHEDDLSKIDVKSLKQKYSNAIEKQSMKSSSSSSGANSTGYMSIRRDISVKHLCRSFGDLSSLNNEEYNTNYFQHVYRTKSVCDLRKLEHLPIYTGVSVRNLRDSYCSLIGLTDTNNLQQQHQQPNSFAFKRSINSIKSSCRGKIINLGIKQFDMKSSFSKFDALQKKNLQALQNGKSGENGVSPDAEKKCHACDKVVFQMEQIKAEKKFWHRSCFRCAECNKQLNVDTYQSHESILYCKPHFKSLFAPKAVEENNEPVKPRKLEMIILESQPIELPPDVARSSDKADLGLDELHQINLRQRFQLFENAGQQDEKVELDKGNSVKRSTSILSKLARFQAKGMDVGVVDDSLNGISYEHSSSEEEDNDEMYDDENDEDIELIRAKRAQKEKPMSFKEMHDIKSKFENGQLMTKEERREERKQELQNIRSRLFMGKQAKIKEMYQQAVAESEQTITSSGKKSDFEVSDKAKSIKEKFEKGEIYDENDLKKTLKEEEMAVFEKGIGKQSRSLFLELDATASKSPIQESPSSANLRTTMRQTTRQNSQTMVSNDDIVRSDQKMDDVQIETADIVSKFKFFETYKAPEKEKKSFRITPPRDYQGLTKLPSPEQEVYKDPHIIRNEKRATDQDEILDLQKTTSKMLSMFRQLEETKEERPLGPKPLKRFTPPPEGERNRYTTNDESEPEYSDEEDEEDEEECSEEESEQEEQDPNYIKSSHKNVDEFLKAAQSAERAKKLREKFEKWEENEIKKEMNNSSVNLYDEAQDEGQMETAKSLRARFEQMQNEEPKLPTNRPVKVNRFV